MDTWQQLEPLYEHFDGMARSITNKNVSHAAAEDIVQDALMQLKDRLESGAKIESPRAWLDRRIKGAATDYARQQFRETPSGFTVESTEDEHLAKPVYEQYQPDPFKQAQQRMDLVSALDMLDADDRAVFTLVEIRGCSQFEAARILGVSQPTVNRRYEQARTKLAEILVDSA